jgi:hypothetical protein
MDDLEYIGRRVEALGASISVGKGCDEQPQLRIDLGEHPTSFYEEGAALAVEIEEICEFHGGRTRYD